MRWRLKYDYLVRREFPQRLRLSHPLEYDTHLPTESDPRRRSELEHPPRYREKLHLNHTNDNRFWFEFHVNNRYDC